MTISLSANQKKFIDILGNNNNKFESKEMQALKQYAKKYDTEKNGLDQGDINEAMKKLGFDAFQMIGIVINPKVLAEQKEFQRIYQSLV